MILCFSYSICDINYNTIYKLWFCELSILIILDFSFFCSLYTFTRMILVTLPYWMNSKSSLPGQNRLMAQTCLMRVWMIETLCWGAFHRILIRRTGVEVSFVFSRIVDVVFFSCGRGCVSAISGFGNFPALAASSRATDVSPSMLKA